LFLERELNESIARKLPAAAVAKSKKELRRGLLETRLQAARDPLANDALQRRVSEVLQQRAPRCVGFYWPLDGEFDARDALAQWLAADASRVACLPVITARGAPLEFHLWSPQIEMRIGEHRIQEPASGQIVTPDLVLVPCVGFDDDGYRLGYGGGYYDRTFAKWRAAGTVPRAVGIAYEACRVSELQREAHDIPLDTIVTDKHSYPRDAG
jgi:5-formyltetrahydrofolate cyclo-ligase